MPRNQVMAARNHQQVPGLAPAILLRTQNFQAVIDPAQPLPVGDAPVNPATTIPHPASYTPQLSSQQLAQARQALTAQQAQVIEQPPVVPQPPVLQQVPVVQAPVVPQPPVIQQASIQQSSVQQAQVVVQVPRRKRRLTTRRRRRTK